MLLKFTLFQSCDKIVVTKDGFMDNRKRVKIYLICMAVCMLFMPIGVAIETVIDYLGDNALIFKIARLFFALAFSFGLIMSRRRKNELPTVSESFMQEPW